MKDMYYAPIEYNSSKKGFYYTEDNYYLPAINIKESDFFAIGRTLDGGESGSIDTRIYRCRE